MVARGWARSKTASNAVLCPTSTPLPPRARQQYDWSNWKARWVSPPGGGPMTDEELLFKQAEAVLAADPGVPGGAPRYVDPAR